MATGDSHATNATTMGKQIHLQLLERYGPVVGGQDLRRLLGYPSPASFRQAAMRGTIPVPVFEIPNRRGRFALTQEVATWLIACRNTATQPTDQVGKWQKEEVE